MENYDALLNASWDNYKDKLAIKSNSYDDERFWKIIDGQNKEWNGVFMFVIDKTTKMPFVETWEFSGKTSFNGVTKYLISKSRHTIGLPDPISQWAHCLYENGLKETASVFYRKQKNIANVYVFHDSVTPDNIKQVKLFSFGVKLRELFQNQMNTEANNEFTQNYPLFNMLSGAVVNLKRHHDGNFYQYSNTTFALLPQEKRLSREQLIKCIDSTYDLSEFQNESNYPSYFEQAKKLTNFVLFHQPKQSEIGKGAYDELFMKFVQNLMIANLSETEARTIMGEIKSSIKANQSFNNVADIPFDTKPQNHRDTSSQKENNFNLDDIPFDVDNKKKDDGDYDFLI